ncbi:hypothetical protein [Nonomuraea sp. NPDC049784]|uniref:hypothetical protein n=1 Tax=Nonomuraea sp. NPDC049784 TaxID=3154361 RepID=UPI0034077F87
MFGVEEPDETLCLAEVGGSLEHRLYGEGIEWTQVRNPGTHAAISTSPSSDRFADSGSAARS